MALFWGLVITGAVLMVRYLSGTDEARTASRPESPELVLAGRFARGEIDEHEYTDRSVTLRGKAMS